MEQEILELKVKAIANENYAKNVIEEYYSNLKTENKRLNNIITELDNFLDKNIKRAEQLLNPKRGIKPYGEEKRYYEIAMNRYYEIKNELKRLKEGNK